MSGDRRLDLHKLAHLAGHKSANTSPTNTFTCKHVYLYFKDQSDKLSAAADTGRGKTNIFFSTRLHPPLTPPPHTPVRPASSSGASEPNKAPHSVTHQHHPLNHHLNFTSHFHIHYNQNEARTSPKTPTSRPPSTHPPTPHSPPTTPPQPHHSHIKYCNIITQCSLHIKLQVELRDSRT